MLGRTCNERSEINSHPSNSDPSLFLSHQRPPRSGRRVNLGESSGLRTVFGDDFSNHTLPHSESFVWTSINQISALSESLSLLSASSFS